MKIGTKCTVINDELEVSCVLSTFDTIYEIMNTEKNISEITIE